MTGDEALESAAIQFLGSGESWFENRRGRIIRSRHHTEAELEFVRFS
jgi:hypothetical protein